MAIWNIKMNTGAIWKLPKASEGINRTLYFYEVSLLKVGETPLSGYQAIEIVPNMEVSLQAVDSNASILVLQGRPINEPVISYGPFVMNTKEEVKQAFEDYHATQFGGWPWPKYDQVHAREKSRFAKHVDGTEELKGS